jgi:hypothetical protein
MQGQMLTPSVRAISLCSFLASPSHSFSGIYRFAETDHYPVWYLYAWWNSAISEGDNTAQGNVMAKKGKHSKGSSLEHAHNNVVGARCEFHIRDYRCNKLPERRPTQKTI